MAASNRQKHSKPRTSSSQPAHASAKRLVNNFKANACLALPEPLLRWSECALERVASAVGAVLPPRPANRVSSPLP